MKTWDVENKKFGRLTAIAICDRTSRGQAIWMCRCDCGGSRSVRAYNLYGGKVRSCGCLTRQNANIKHVGSGGIPGWLWAQYKRNAESRGIEFDLSADQLRVQLESQSGKCALTGDKLVFVPSKSKCRSGNASLDRIDPDHGYVSGNVQWVVKKVNFCKYDLSVKEFIELCNKVVQFTQS